MAIKPVRDFISIKDIKLNKEDKKSLIWIDDKYKKAEVVSVGEDVKYIKSGDFVYFIDNGGIVIEDSRFIKFTDVLGVWQK